MSNFFGSSSTNNEATQAELGSRLYNIKQSSIGTESVLSILPDNNVVVNTCSSFGKSLLNVSSLNGLVGLINSADTQVQVLEAGSVGSVDITVDNALKMSIKSLYSEVLNELRSLNINPLTDLEYSLGTSNKRWNNIYGNKIVDCQAVRSGASSIPFMQNTNVSTASGQNVLWQHTTNETTPTNFQLLLETKDINTNFERMQISSYRNAYRNLHLQPSGKVLIGGDFSNVADSTLGTLNVRGTTTVLNLVGSNYPEIMLKDTTNTGDYMVLMRDHAGNKNIIRNSGRLDIESPANYPAMTILSNGTLGINNTAPTEKLDVVGNVKISSQLAIGTSINSTYTVDVRRTGVDNYQRISGDVAKKQGLIFSDGATPTDIWTFYKKETTKTLNIYNNTTSSDLMTFTSTNQVGINCTPLGSSTLEVRGSSSSSYLRIAGATSLQQALVFTDTEDRWAWYKPANSTDLRLYNYVSTNPKDLMTFTQTNLVGLGTNNPVYNLHINTSGTSAFAGNDKKGLLITDSTVPRILLENLGNTSGQRLSAIQNISGIWSVGVLTDTGGAWGKERILGLNLGTYDATFAGHILTDSVGTKNIGSTGNPFAKIFTVDADISNLISNVKTMNLTPTATNTYTIGASSSTQYNAIYGNTVYGNGVVLTSDINKKKDIQPIEDALSVIMRFESKSFKFKDGTSNRTHTGFIAQQIKEVVPDDWALYCDNKLGDIGLKYTEIIPLNTRAIQQLNERLTKVENRRLVGGSIIDTSSLTEDMTQIYERLDHLSTKYLELENQPVRPTLHKCIEVSRFNEMYDQVSHLEARLSAFDEVKDDPHSEDFEVVHSLIDRNHQLELRVNELENKLNQIQSQPKVESKSIDLLESDGGVNMNELLQQKNFELEQRMIKLEKQNKRLVQAVNKLLKTSE